MTPTFGAERLLGLNPIGVAIPTREEVPFIFDASVSSVAGNKVRLAQRLGRNTLPGWISRDDGQPIMDDVPIPEGFMLLPLGGNREIGSHKGYGLSVMIEALTSVVPTFVGSETLVKAAVFAAEPKASRIEDISVLRLDGTAVD